MMKQSEAIKQFVKLYWDELTPEQINFLGQAEHEVAQLEAENEALGLYAEFIVEKDYGAEYVEWYALLTGEESDDG